MSGWTWWDGFWLGFAGTIGFLAATGLLVAGARAVSSLRHRIYLERCWREEEAKRIQRRAEFIARVNAASGRDLDAVAWRFARGRGETDEAFRARLIAGWGQ